MTFSQYAGIAIVPTLSRLVLGLAFVLFGYSKVFVHSDFDEVQAQKLKAVGVEVTRKAQPASAQIRSEALIMLASYRQDQPADDPTTAQDNQPEAPSVQDDEVDQQDPAEQLPEAPSTAEAPNGKAPPPVDPSSSQPLPAGTYTGKSLHNITLMLIEESWPQPKYMAWAAALTELIGGGLILIGLFSRLAGLGIASVMGVAFYLASLPLLMAKPVMDLQPQELSSIFLQLSFLVLALGITFTGAGPLSLDRLLFSRPHHVPESQTRKKLD